MRSVFEQIFLLAAVQGFLLAGLLFVRKQNHAANTVLCVLVAAMSLDLLQAVYYMKELYLRYPHLMGITYIFPFLYGPLYYLYVLLLTAEKRKVERMDLLHFLPALLVLAHGSWVYFLSGPEKIAFIRLMNADRPWNFRLVENLIPVQGFVYTLLTVRALARHNNRIRGEFSNIDRINLVWLRSLTIGVVVIWSVVIVGTIASDLFRLESPGSNVAIYFCISLLIYAIGYLGLSQPEVFRQSADQEVRYAKSGLSDATAEEIVTRLQELMETGRPFLNGGLTLGGLAELLSVSPHNLSEAMNTRLQQSFYDYVNAHRVNEVKRRLQSGDGGTYSLLSIALDSGFTSKTSFNTIFKKQTGMTPSRFMKHRPPSAGGATADGQEAAGERPRLQSR